MKNILPLIPFLILFSNSLVSAQDSILVKPYLQFSTQNSIHVLWETTAPATTLVEYEEIIKDKASRAFSKQVKLEGTRILHELKLEGLKVSTIYKYRVRSIFQDGNEVISATYTLKTSAKVEEAIYFALIGDTQYQPVTPWAWTKIAQRIAELHPQFIIHAGDLVDRGPEKSDWVDHFFAPGHPIMSRYPMYTVLGNHEQNAQLYYDYMVNPEPEYYYTFQYGPVQFFMLDTNRDVSEGSEQYNWLEWTLAQSDAPWKIVVHHHPPYSSQKDNAISTYKTFPRKLSPLYETYGVDFCLFGHTHLYERTYPLYKDRISMENGVIYINSGGAGGGLSELSPHRSWFSRERKMIHHFCTFAIFENHLTFRAIDHNGQIFDFFELKKEKFENGQPITKMLVPPPPRIDFDYLIFHESKQVTLTPLSADHSIYYTLDGTEPTLQSNKYNIPIQIQETSTLKARTYNVEGQASRVIERAFTKIKPLEPINISKTTQPGLAYNYYEGDWLELPDFKILTPVSSGVTPIISCEVEQRNREDHFGIVFEGYISIKAMGTYQFYLHSDDGSKLYINDQLIINNDGSHSSKTEKGVTLLKAGKHNIRIEYFDDYGGDIINAGFVHPEMGLKPFGPWDLSH